MRGLLGVAWRRAGKGSRAIRHKVTWTAAGHCGATRGTATPLPPPQSLTRARV